LCAVHSACADTDLQISAAEIFGYGVFETSSSSRHSGFTARKIAADSVTGVHFVDFTNEIPMTLGTNFGFEYSINTTPRGQSIKVRSVIRFPEGGLTTPRGKVYTESVEHKSVKIGHRSLHGYGFDEAWEMVPGKWTFEVWYKNARLIRKTFTIVEPDEEISE
jgi:hypothetical protein